MNIEEDVNDCKGNRFEKNGCSYNHLLAHPTDCTKFLQCSNEYEYIKPCPDSLVFNVGKQECDYLHNVERCWDVG